MTINVTKTFLPPLEEYTEYLKGIWERGHLTNHGPLVLELERKLRDYFGVKHFFFLNNGTIALQIAVKALDLKGEIITTPFSYVATTSSICWEGATPVFVDIDPKTLCLDPAQIEKAITPSTSAILATHVYGNPCAVEEIREVAAKHNLRVIYDAAHAFGVRYRGKPLLGYGDVSTISFHATKLFHTIEGGAIVTNDDSIAHKISYMRNFGHNGPEDFFGMGINGKNCEFRAAMGLAIFPKVQELIAKRRQISELYDKSLSECRISRPLPLSGTEYNYAYYPVLFESEAELLAVRESLNAVDIYPRRYFYPALNTLNYVSNAKMPVAESISRRVLCLPLFPELPEGAVESISGVIRKICC